MISKKALFNVLDRDIESMKQNTADSLYIWKDIVVEYQYALCFSTIKNYIKNLRERLE